MEGVLYDGAGNLFLMFDGRGISNLEVEFPSERVVSLCSAVPGTVPDGLIVLLDPAAEGCDFSMHYFNRDGSGGSMCGNGGRCIAAFARDLGIRPSSEDGIYRFIAAGKPYSAEILEDSGATKVVRLSLPDVEDAENLPDPAGWYLDTGCPHFVSFLKDAEALETLDIEPAALPLRHHKAFPNGLYRTSGEGFIRYPHLRARSRGGNSCLRHRCRRLGSFSRTRPEPRRASPPWFQSPRRQSFRRSDRSRRAQERHSRRHRYLSYRPDEKALSFRDYPTRFFFRPPSQPSS